jgi:hypothetical protein
LYHRPVGIAGLAPVEVGRTSIARLQKSADRTPRGGDRDKFALVF